MAKATQDFLYFDVAGPPHNMSMPQTLPTRPSYLSNLLRVPDSNITDRWSAQYSDNTGIMGINGIQFNHQVWLYVSGS